MKVNEILLTEEELLAESILSAVRASVESVKRYATNISTASAAHKELRSLDGKKVWTTENLKQEAMRMREVLASLVSSASDKVKSAVDAAIKKMGAAALAGAYTSRNYYRDFISYSMIKPVVDVTKMDAGKFGVDKVVDFLIGFAITAVTGVPSIDDIRNAGQMASSMVKASNSLASQINNLKPAQLGEALTIL